MQHGAFAVACCDGLTQPSLLQTVRSQGMWLFAMDYLFLAFGQIAMSQLVYKCANTMPRWWAHLGMVAGFVGLINFLVELGRLGTYAAPRCFCFCFCFCFARTLL